MLSDVFFVLENRFVCHLYFMYLFVIFEFICFFFPNPLHTHCGTSGQPNLLKGVWDMSHLRTTVWYFYYARLWLEALAV